MIKLIELLVQIRNLIFKNFIRLITDDLSLWSNLKSRNRALPSNGMMSVGENKLESGVSEEATSFNGIVTIGASLERWDERLVCGER